MNAREELGLPQRILPAALLARTPGKRRPDRRVLAPGSTSATWGNSSRETSGSIDGIILCGTELLLLFQSPALAGVPALDTKALHVTAIVERLPDRCRACRTSSWYGGWIRLETGRGRHFSTHIPGQVGKRLVAKGKLSIGVRTVAELVHFHPFQKLVPLHRDSAVESRPENRGTEHDLS